MMRDREGERERDNFGSLSCVRTLGALVRQSDSSNHIAGGKFEYLIIWRSARLSQKPRFEPTFRVNRDESKNWNFERAFFFKFQKRRPTFRNFIDFVKRSRGISKTIIKVALFLFLVSLRRTLSTVSLLCNFLCVQLCLILFTDDNPFFC